MSDLARVVYEAHVIEFSTYYEKDGVVSERLICKCHATFVGERPGEASRLYDAHLVNARLEQLEVRAELAEERTSDK